MLLITTAFIESAVVGTEEDLGIKDFFIKDLRSCLTVALWNSACLHEVAQGYKDVKRAFKRWFV